MRVRGDRADNRERAIAAHEAALTIYRKEQHPIEWAKAQTNLANAYSRRIRGERGENLERAIAGYEAALTGFTRERIPMEWAKVQNNLGSTYSERVRGSRMENLRKAVDAFEASLTVRTRDAEPHEHLATAKGLGEVALEQRDWTKAGAAYASAREAFLLLFGQGLDEQEAQYLIATAGTLFAEAAFVAAQRGDGEAALELASEGKARLLSVSLRLRALDLEPEDRRRIDQLRIAIRLQAQAYATTAGTERTAALDQLAALRRELLGLVERTGVGQGKAMALALRLVPKDGAVVVPIVTKRGGKLLIMTQGASAPVLTLLDVPELHSERLYRLMNGTGTSVGAIGGWLGTFNIQYLPAAARAQRIGEWLNAIERIGPDLWRMFVGRVDAALRERGVMPGSRVIWLPAGALGLLPVGLAHDPVEERRFGDRYELVTAPSLDALDRSASSDRTIHARFAGGGHQPYR